MRYDINLASQPYEDAARFYRNWVSALALVALVTFLLVALAVSNFLGARSVRLQVNQVRQQIARLDQEKAAAEAILNRPENRGTRDRSRFLNGLIARKAFSWTQVFADLEQIVPARVQVKAIQPNLTEDNQLQVHMQIAGDSREKVVEMVRRLEGSPSFRSPRLQSETSRTEDGREAVEFEVVALYVPQRPEGTR